MPGLRAAGGAMAQKVPTRVNPPSAPPCLPCSCNEQLRRLPPCDALGLLDADPLPNELSADLASAYESASCQALLCGPLGQFAERVAGDHRNFYNCRTFWTLGYALAGGSVLANTSLDEDFGSWYQRDVRSAGTDDVASFCKTFGEGEIFIPAFAGLAVAAAFLPETPTTSAAGDFAGRTTRAYLVGAPPVLFTQWMLGGSRPGEAPLGSRWQGFDDTNSVSGHAFVGAVPLITAAQMTERPAAKAALYACSTLTAWSRVNDDAHYLSQACLGWCMAWLACRAVDRTDEASRFCRVVPLATPESSGIGLIFAR